jgi:hypothetical protein
LFSYAEDLAAQAVDPADDEEDGEGDEQEAQEIVEEEAVVEGGRARLLRLLQGLVIPSGQNSLNMALSLFRPALDLF